MIYVDFDDVLGDLMTEWLLRYNSLTGADHQPEDVTGWDWVGQVAHPEVMYGILLDPDLYDFVEPLPGAIDGMKRLMGAFPGEVMIASSCSSIVMIEGKLGWLRRHGLWDGPYYTWPDLFIPIRNKTLLRGSWLIDDKPEAVAGFNGIGVLFDSPHNHSYCWNAGHRVHNWGELTELILGS